VKAVVSPTNLVKLAAARTLFHRVLGDDVRIEALGVDSDVSRRPCEDEKTLRRALRPAQAALRKEGATLGAELEGGFVEMGEWVFACASCAAGRDHGVRADSGGPGALLPLRVAGPVRGRTGPGPATEALPGLLETKLGPGATETPTDGRLDDQTIHERLSTLAAARLLTPDGYAADPVAEQGSD
jgi:non-canonical (house-cleaning) NTP pyrophosphatase